MCYEGSKMITPNGLYVSVTIGTLDGLVADDTRADDRADDKPLTLSLSTDVVAKGKEELGIIMARLNSVDPVASRRHSISSQHEKHGRVLLDLQSAIFGEDILDKMDAVETKCLTIVDDTDIEIRVLSDLLNRLAIFEPNYLNEVVFVAQNEERMMAIESLCQETFCLAMQSFVSRNVTVHTSKEEFTPLLDKIHDPEDISEGKLTVSEHIISGFRKLAQLVMDALISVKTEDEDVQPYGETS